MKRNLQAFAAVILLFSFAYTPAIPSLAASATYYVSADGIRDGACPTTAPCQLEYAVSLANATTELDTIYLSSGSYTKATDNSDAFLSITNSIKMVGGCVCGYTTCTPNNPDTILSGEGERRILKLDFTEPGGEVTLENIKFEWGNGNRLNDTECMINMGCGGAIFVDGVEPGISKIWNNSLGHLYRGFSFSGLSNVDMSNNILARAQDATSSTDWPNITLTGQNNLVYDVDDLNNFPTINRLQLDPLFVNAAQGDFHLIEDSPAIGAGTSGLSAPIITDIDGDPRVLGLPDIGADEYALETYLPVIIK